MARSERIVGGETCMLCMLMCLSKYPWKEANSTWRNPLCFQWRVVFNRKEIWSEVKVKLKEYYWGIIQIFLYFKLPVSQSGPFILIFFFFFYILFLINWKWWLIERKKTEMGGPSRGINITAWYAAVTKTNYFLSTHIPLPAPKTKIPLQK